MVTAANKLNYCLKPYLRPPLQPRKERKEDPLKEQTLFDSNVLGRFSNRERHRQRASEKIFQTIFDRERYRARAIDQLIEPSKYSSFLWVV